MREATARAARRRGSSISTRWPFIQDSSRIASGTTVLLPAPGGAWRTTERWVPSASCSAGSTSSIGRPDFTTPPGRNLEEEEAACERKPPGDERKSPHRRHGAYDP